MVIGEGKRVADEEFYCMPSRLESSLVAKSICSFTVVHPIDNRGLEVASRAILKVAYKPAAGELHLQ